MYKYLLIFAFYFVFKFLLKNFFPFVFKYLSNKIKVDFQSKQKSASSEPNEKEGEVSIDSMPKSKKTSNNKVGDYIDYEELD